MKAGKEGCEEIKGGRRGEGRAANQKALISAGQLRRSEQELFLTRHAQINTPALSAALFTPEFIQRSQS